MERAPRSAYLPKELSKSVLPDHYLQPGDAVLIEPVDLESDIRLPADQRLLADGRIDLGEFGRVRIAGLTLEQSEDLIEEVIVESGEEPTQINVRMLEPIHRYYVLGEVNSPGSYPLVGHETVLDGILAAGGLTTAAAPCKVLLARPTPPPSCRIVLPICYQQITQLGDTTTNYQLQPGDRIYIAARNPCEEICFWKTTETCEFCNGCQSVCRDPSIFGFRNPLWPIPVADRLPVPHEDWKVDPFAEQSTNGEPALPSPAASGPNAVQPGGRLDTPPETIPPPRVRRPRQNEPRRTVPAEDPTDRLPETIDGELDLQFPGRTSSAAARFLPMWASRPAAGR